jgi:hypothetical protein
MRSTGAAALSTLVLADLALLAASPAAAQDDDADDGHVPRSGFWVGGGALVVTPALDLPANVVESGGGTLAVSSVAVGVR